MTLMGSGPETPVATVIIGAGVAGRLVLEEVRKRPRMGYLVRGFVDDNADLKGATILGVPVLGGSKDLPRIKEQHGIAQAIIAMPSVQGQSVRKIVDLCRKAGITTRIVPGAIDVLSGRATVSASRPVEVEDLLRRETLVLSKEVGSHYAGKSVLVTGAAGSIGSELCRVLLGLNIRELITFDSDENGTFDLEMELQGILGGREQPPRLVPVVGSILNPSKVDWLLSMYRPDIVFHAAARKHVPLMETFPEEAVETNVLGTKTMAETCIARGVGAFVHISTDKAVEPSSVMGTTKRLSEIIIRRLAQRAPGTKFVVVRFGNVIGSRSSLLDVLRSQLTHGGPITLTHPAMTRFFMTANEAAVLLLHAVVLGNSADILALDMGEPIRIADLARDAIALSGYAEEDIEIRFVGPRPGEKFTERLCAPDERLVPTRHPRILRVEGVEDPALSDEALDQLLKRARTLDRDRIRSALHEMVREYRSATPESEAP